MADEKAKENDCVVKGECQAKRDLLEQRLAEGTDMFKALSDKLDALDARLYRDNGHKSIQSILNYHGQIIRVICWLGGIVATSSISTFLFLLWGIIKSHIRGG